MRPTRPPLDQRPIPSLEEIARWRNEAAEAEVKRREANRLFYAVRNDRSMRRVDQIALLLKMGATERDICLIFNFYPSNLRGYLKKLGIIKPLAPPKSRSHERWLDVVPERVAAEQAQWELGCRIMRATEQGATLQQIADRLNCSPSAVGQRKAKAWRLRRQRSPVERWLSEVLDMRRLAAFPIDQAARPALTRPQQALILWREGMTLKGISERMGIGRECVRLYLRKAGVPAGEYPASTAQG